MLRWYYTKFFIVCMLLILSVTGCVASVFNDKGKDTQVFISISPAVKTVRPGGAASLIIVNRNTNVIWPKDVAGSFIQNGSIVIYTPPAIEGEYEFTVIASADPAITATARIFVKEPLPLPGHKLTAGVFGASHSISYESEAAKEIWVDLNDIVITNCGIGGSTFSSKLQYNVPYQIENAEPFDIYILWSPTNDAHSDVAVGDVNDNDPATQNGALLRSIELIRQKNNDALILLFTSLPRFDSKIIYDRLALFVEGQRAFANNYDIPYLDQWTLSGFDWNNYQTYYYEDKVHLSIDGYKHIAPMQANFIFENIQNYYSWQK